MTKDVIETMFNNISIIEDMSGYNVFNILDSKGDSWLADRYNILNDTRFSNTVLYIYYQLCKDTINLPGYSTPLLKLAIKKYIRMFKPRLQSANEQAIYIRLGDAICDSERYDQSDYFNLVGQIDPTRKTVIVCCLSFAGKTTPRESWKHSTEAIQVNRLFFIDFIESLLSRTTLQNIEIYSPLHPDLAICYLTSGGFISNSNTTWYKHLNYSI